MYRATTTRKVEMKVRIRWNNEQHRQICRFSYFFSRDAICNFSYETRVIYTIHWQAHMFETTLRFFTEEQKISKNTVEEWMYAISMYKCVIEICVVDVTTNCLRKKVDAHPNKTKWKKAKKKKKHVTYSIIVFAMSTEENIFTLDNCYKRGKRKEIYLLQ